MPKYYTGFKNNAKNKKHRISKILLFKVNDICILKTMPS